jgi:hypothetical protein
MSGLCINDLDLLRYCHASVTGKEMEVVKNEFPKQEYACFGEYHENGEPMWAVTIYDFKKDHDCKLDIAMDIRGLFSRELFEKMAKVVFGYVFNQANLLRCTIQVRASNKRSLRLVKRWGFKEEGLIRNGYGPPKIEDMYILGMLRQECRFIGGLE